MKVKLLFIAANILFISLAAWLVMPERMFVLAGQGTSLSLKERQLSVLNHNFTMHEENAALLSALQEEEGLMIVIQPAGQLGALLSDIREMLRKRGLHEQEFYASEQAVHYVNGRHVSETRATIAAYGDYYGISALIRDISLHYRYLRVERLQISEEILFTRVLIIFVVYEEQLS